MFEHIRCLILFDQSLSSQKTFLHLVLNSRHLVLVPPLIVEGLSIVEVEPALGIRSGAVFPALSAHVHRHVEACVVPCEKGTSLQLVFQYQYRASPDECKHWWPLPSTVLLVIIARDDVREFRRETAFEGLFRKEVIPGQLVTWKIDLGAVRKLRGQVYLQVIFIVSGSGCSD